MHIAALEVSQLSGQLVRSLVVLRRSCHVGGQTSWSRKRDSDNRDHAPIEQCKYSLKGTGQDRLNFVVKLLFTPACPHFCFSRAELSRCRKTVRRVPFHSHFHSCGRVAAASLTEAVRTPDVPKLASERLLIGFLTAEAPSNEMASAVSNLKPVGTSGNERFNAEAAAWDSKPLVQEASRQAAKAILKRLEDQKVDVSKIDNLEIGCGTGILSFLLAPHFHRIVSIDAAEGMIEVLRQKIARPDSPKNITPIAVLLEDPEDSVLPPGKGGTGRQKFHLITSHLVLHHIPELEGVLRTMFGCLKPGGKVMLTDFQNFGPEARRFHPESKMEGVARHGIHVDEMGALMSSVGFVNVDIQVAWSMEKSVEAFPGEFQTHGEPGKGGQDHKMHFPFILCYGEKRGS